MKKVLSIVLAICLVATLSLSAFAATTSLKDSAMSVVTSIKPNMNDTDKAAYNAIVTVLNNTGALDDYKISKAEFVSAVDSALANGAITQAQHDTIISQVNSGEWDALFETTLTNAGSGSISEADIQKAIAQIKDIVSSDKSTEEKATAIADLLSGFSNEQIVTILTALRTAGVIDEEMYNKISDALNSGDTGVTLPAGGGDSSSVDGLKDMISGLLAGLGIGGGDSGDSTKETTTKKASSNKNDFEGGSAKTGDYAVVSIAGVAVAAGVALVLTKKKK